MKTLKRMTAGMLVVVALMTIMVIPTSAAPVFYSSSIGSTWVSTFAEDFPTLGKLCESSHYVYALQRYLKCFDTTAKNMLVYGGQYMDGEFGGRTENAVKYVQKQLGLPDSGQDGIVGPNTWTKIAQDLNSYTDTKYSGVKLFQRSANGGQIYITGKDSDNWAALFYHVENDSTDRWVYFASNYY